MGNKQTLNKTLTRGKWPKANAMLCFRNRAGKIEVIARVMRFLLPENLSGHSRNELCWQHAAYLDSIAIASLRGFRGKGTQSSQILNQREEESSSPDRWLVEVLLQMYCGGSFTAVLYGDSWLSVDI